jgi:hypothetical protein
MRLSEKLRKEQEYSLAQMGLETSQMREKRERLEIKRREEAARSLQKIKKQETLGNRLF